MSDDDPVMATAHEDDVRSRMRQMLRRWSALKAIGPSRDDDVRTASASPSEQLWWAPPLPYPGLRSFDPSDADVFFARNPQVDALSIKLADSNVITVVGGSGCGKSSLVRAGLIPKLTGDAGVPGRPGRWYTLEFKPGEDPNRALIAAIRDRIVLRICRYRGPDDRDGEPTLGHRALAAAFSLDPASPPDELQASAVAHITQQLFGKIKDGDLRGATLDVDALLSLASGPLNHLDRVLSRGYRAGPPNLFILIDQFEEAFRTEVSAPARKNLCHLVEGVKKSHSGSTFVAVTVRSEELHRCTEAGLASLVTETAFFVAPLDEPESLQDIIVLPAREVFTDWIWRPADPDEAIPDLDAREPARGATEILPTSPFSAEVVELLTAESQRLLDGMGHKPDYLPLLQHALLRVWDCACHRWQETLDAIDWRTPPEITLADLHRAIGDGEATAGFLHRCLNKYADEAYATARRSIVAKRSSAGAKRSADLLLRTAFCALARRDDRGNWSRRYTTASRVASLLPEDKEATPADREAAERILRAFTDHGYLNIGPGSGEPSYDVSHEALIRNWERYNRDWLSEVARIEESLADVIKNLDAAEARRQAQARTWSGRLKGWFQTSSDRATHAVPDRVREDVGLVFGENPAFSPQLAAVFLADREERGNLGQEQLVQSAVRGREPARPDRSDLEQTMKLQIETAREPWRLAHRRARYLVTPVFCVVLALIISIASFAVAATLRSWKVDLANDEAAINAVSAVALRQSNQPFELDAFELHHAFRRIEWVQQRFAATMATDDMRLAVFTLLTSAHALAGSVTIRPLPSPDAPGKQADCRSAEDSSPLFRAFGRLALGITFDPEQRVWNPTFRLDQQPPQLALPPDSRGYVPPEKSIVCLTQDASLLMTWPQTEDPTFLALDWACSRMAGTACVGWQASWIPLKVRTSGAWGGATKSPWAVATRSTGADPSAVSPAWSVANIREYQGPVSAKHPRVGFAINAVDHWVLADISPGEQTPVPDTSMTPNPAWKQWQACNHPQQTPCVYPKQVFDGGGQIEIKHSESDPSRSTDSGARPEHTDQGVRQIALEVWWHPSTNTSVQELVQVRNVQFIGTTVQTFATDGTWLDIKGADGLWRRLDVGQEAARDSLEKLQPQHDPSDRYLSLACKTKRCWEWDNEPQTSYLQWAWTSIRQIWDPIVGVHAEAGGAGNASDGG